MSSKTIILGGGLTGLSACYHSNAIVYEKNQNIGGHARSHINNGFVSVNISPSIFNFFNFSNSISSSTNTIICELRFFLKSINND